MILTSHSKKINFFRFFVDSVMVILSWILAYYLRFNAGLIELTKGDDSFLNYFRLAPLLLMVYILIFISTGVYKRTLEKRRIWSEYYDLLRVHILSFFTFVTLAYFIYSHRYSRITLLIFLLILPFMLAIGRSFVRKINRYYLLKYKKANKKAIIVGTGESAQELVSQCTEQKEWGINIAKQVKADDANSVRKFLESDSVDLVFIAVSIEENPCLKDIYASLGNTMAEIIVIPDLGGPAFLTPKIITLDNKPVLAINTSNLEGLGILTKRLFDITFATVFILCFSWLYIICALLVKFTSKGPIFYKQERMGLDGKVFWCLKFRGMHTNAETNTGPVWAKANDSRTTYVGKWLRKSSLDEIPQFINVLVGDMSVVGPRPERPIFVDQFRHKIPGYMLRHKAKAGITGWAQINGWRGNTSLEKRIQCDLWYIQNWSIWLDLKICILTPLKGLIHKNAY